MGQKMGEMPRQNFVKKEQFQSIGKKMGEAVPKKNLKKQVDIMKKGSSKFVKDAGDFYKSNASKGKFGKIVRSKGFRKALPYALTVARIVAPRLPYYKAFSLSLKLISLGLKASGHKGIPDDPISLMEAAATGAKILNKT